MILARKCEDEAAGERAERGRAGPCFGAESGYHPPSVYQALLTRKYLFSKVMPLLAALAVTLCTAMVLVVWSIMGGFLITLLAAGRTMVGDVTIAAPIYGIRHYQELLEMLREDPIVDAATPTIETLALMSLPTGESYPVQVMGVEPEGYHRVTGYADNLFWQVPRADKVEAVREANPDDFRLNISEAYAEAGRTLREPSPRTGEMEDAAAIGIEAGRTNLRRGGSYFPRFGVFWPDQRVTLGFLPLTGRGAVLSLETVEVPVANEIRTGLHEWDQNWVVVPLGLLQELLKMDDRAVRVRDSTAVGEVVIGPDGSEQFVLPEVVEQERARVTNILLRAAAGHTPEQLMDRVDVIYRKFAERFAADGVPSRDRVAIFTWDRKPGIAYFISAVKKEIAMVVFLFAFISIVAVFLVFAIFWSMVSQKTKDVGVLRAIGASRAGVAWLFLRYGLAIGAVGALAGGALASIVVSNINAIHEWMGRVLNLQIWDPQVYFFSDIPSQVDPVKAILVMGMGVLSALVGALAPALHAARMDPVRALRFE